MVRVASIGTYSKSDNNQIFFSTMFFIDKKSMPNDIVEIALLNSRPLRSIISFSGLIVNTLSSLLMLMIKRYLCQLSGSSRAEVVRISSIVNPNESSGGA